MSLIRLHKISRRYQMGAETVHALREVSLDIRRGEYVGIMGPSGSGKSTLMNLIGCLDSPTSGEYELNGIQVSEMDDNERTLALPESSFACSTSSRNSMIASRPMPFAGSVIASPPIEAIVTTAALVTK